MLSGDRRQAVIELPGLGTCNPTAPDEQNGLVADIARLEKPEEMRHLLAEHKAEVDWILKLTS